MSLPLKLLGSANIMYNKTANTVNIFHQMFLSLVFSIMCARSVFANVLFISFFCNLHIIKIYVEETTHTMFLFIFLPSDFMMHPLEQYFTSQFSIRFEAITLHPIIRYFVAFRWEVYHHTRIVVSVHLR